MRFRRWLPWLLVGLLLALGLRTATASTNSSAALSGLEATLDAMVKAFIEFLKAV